MQDLRIAAVQMNCRVAEHDRNLATIERFAEEAAAQDVDIVCFPELCVCGYNAGDTSTPEPEPLEGEMIVADLSASALAESRRETLMFFRHYRRPEMYRRWENEIRSGSADQEGS